MENNNNEGTNGANPANERFRIVTKLESGGMADIFLGVQAGAEEAFERLVVIKKVRVRGKQVKQAMGMFIDEARVVASLNHPHIVKIYDLSKVKNSVSITMEYIDGENLSFILKWLKKSGKTIPLSIACRLMIQACEAIHYAHTAVSQDGKNLEIIHRDIDLRNLMVDKNGYLKIIDFGVAKATTQVELTAPMMFKGKLSYVAPETFQDTEIDARADIYAMGLVFYQIVTGVNPFPFKTDVNLGEVIQRVSNEKVKPPTSIMKGLPLKIDALIARATHKDREKRFQTAEEFAASIRKFAGIANTDEVKKWFASEFERRFKQRRQYEQKVMKRARELSEDAAGGTGIRESTPDSEKPTVPPEPESPSMVPLPRFPTIPPRPPSFSSSSGSSITTSSSVTPPSTASSVSQAGTPQSTSNNATPVATPSPPYPPEDKPKPSYPPGDIPMVSSPLPTPKSKFKNPYLLIAAAFVVFIVVALIVQQLSVEDDAKSPEPVEIAQKSEPQETLPKEAETNQAAVQIEEPADEKPVDEEPADEKPADENPVDEEAEEVVLPDNDSPPPAANAYWIKQWKRKQKKKRTTAQQDSPAPPREAVAEQPAPAPAPSEQPEAQPQEGVVPTPYDKEQKKKEPETTWYSGHGNWSGGQVASKGCIKCHPRGLDLESKEPKEWITYFRQKKHNRHGRLDEHFSPKEQVRVLRYMLKKIKQSQE